MGSKYSEYVIGMNATYSSGSHQFSYNLENRTIEAHKKATEGMIFGIHTNYRYSARDRKQLEVLTGLFLLF